MQFEEDSDEDVQYVPDLPADKFAKSAGGPRSSSEAKSEVTLTKIVAVPGDVIHDFGTNGQGNCVIGEGVTMRGYGSAVASIAGVAEISHSGSNVLSIQIVDFGKESEDVKIVNKSEDISGSGLIGQYVRAIVTRVNFRVVSGHICTIGNKLVTHATIKCQIRRVDVREFEKDKVELIDCFVPGDIVYAKVIAEGDKNGVLLSTVEDFCGVVIARHEESGQLMKPISAQFMMDPINNKLERRKVAKPDSRNSLCLSF